MRSLFSIFSIFFRLGCWSFGGPVAHLGYFQREFVDKRQWLSEQEYLELIALCNFLPGPASSQTGMAIGYQQRGVLGSLVAFAGFTLPSMLLMIAFALLMTTQLSNDLEAILHGFKLLAVVVVADAILKMLRVSIKSHWHSALVAGTAIAVLLLPGAAAQLIILLFAAWLGYLFMQPKIYNQTHSDLSEKSTSGAKVSQMAAIAFVAGWALLLVASWLLPSTAWLESIYRVGATVFGGGHVVLPLLSAEQSITSTVMASELLAGYSIAQAIPGPMFTLASYLGVMLGSGVLGGVIATILIFLPGWLLLLAVLPHWENLRSNRTLRGILGGVQLGVIGLLAATLYSFVWVGTVNGAMDMAVVVGLWWLLCSLKWPVWRVVLVAGVSGLVAFAG
ncbi:chromate efflux transporter [Neptunomonas phycophila]|jgi:chromate transporter|uniref:chromate efflux transporter n=1 Tax=Neptunomonas TaxID=75687 RepID=UPI001BE7F673|nr:chromate efflux transporter [Neptunomonas phycophila]MBT3146705.1 chromate efflux transporter [Neptunomonas phycophila]